MLPAPHFTLAESPTSKYHKADMALQYNKTEHSKMFSFAIELYSNASPHLKPPSLPWFLCLIFTREQADILHGWKHIFPWYTCSISQCGSKFFPRRTISNAADKGLIELVVGMFRKTLCCVVCLMDVRLECLMLKLFKGWHCERWSNLKIPSDSTTSCPEGRWRRDSLEIGTEYISYA